MNNIKLSNLESVGLVLIIIINHVILNFSKSIIANTGSASALNNIFIGIIVLLFVQLLLFLFKHFSCQDIFRCFAVFRRKNIKSNYWISFYNLFYSFYKYST